jgi:hypothetical protein
MTCCHTMLADQMDPGLTWWCQGHTLKAYMKVLELGAYDAILGFDWLRTQESCDLSLAGQNHRVH